MSGEHSFLVLPLHGMAVIVPGRIIPDNGSDVIIRHYLLLYLVIILSIDL